VIPFGEDGDEEGRGGSPVPVRSATRLAELEALAAHIGQEFANLLVPVLGGATMIEEEIPDGHPLRRRAEGIRDATVAARGFAWRLALLDGKRKLLLRQVEIGALVRECVPAMREHLRAGIAIDVAPGAEFDLVRVDRKQMEHALVELARNVEDALPGPGSLRIDFAAVEGGAGGLPAGRWVRLCARDSGRGMEPSLLEHAFEPFVTTKVPGGGAGLGLSVVASIVRQHGGLVGAESSPGAGTTVSIYLPRQVSGDHEREVTPPAFAAAAPAAVSGTGAAVLLVEDNSMVRRSIEVTLRAAGFQVTSVDSGQRCIQTVERLDVPLDLLISDVVMPEMSGEEMLGRVRKLRPELPVLFISGYDRSTLARRKHPAATEHFLQKPFDSEDLFEAVRKALQTRPGPAGQ